MLSYQSSLCFDEDLYLKMWTEIRLEFPQPGLNHVLMPGINVVKQKPKVIKRNKCQPL